jgi:hypothetical protein
LRSAVCATRSKGPPRSRGRIRTTPGSVPDSLASMPMARVPRAFKSSADSGHLTHPHFDNAKVPGTVMSDAASDQFVFEKGHGPEPHDRTTRYDQGPAAAPSRRFSFCFARVGPDTPSAASSWSGTRQVLYSITKHVMRRSADEIGAISISFRPKVFSDPASLLTEFFPPIKFARQESNRAHGFLALIRTLWRGLRRANSCGSRTSAG